MAIGLKVLAWLVFAIMCVGMGIAIAIAMDRRAESTRAAERWAIGFFAGAVVMLIAAVAVTLSIGQLTEGQAGVVLRFGKFTGRVIQPGFYTITPFVNSVVVMDTQDQKYVEVASAASKDLQDVSTEVTLQFRVDNAMAGQVWARLRTDYISRVVQPSILETVKANTALFNAEELITRRPDVKAAIENHLRGRLQENGLEQLTVSLTDFKFSESFTMAIEAKVTAVQKALEAENKLKQVEWEAAQAKALAQGQASAAIAQAEGQRQSAILKAEGEASAIKTVADAQAEANLVVNKTLTDAIIRYTLVQKLAAGVKTIVLPSGQDFILGESVLGTATP